MLEFFKYANSLFILSLLDSRGKSKDTFLFFGCNSSLLVLLLLIMSFLLFSFSVFFRVFFIPC